ncbi:hypothetical protein DRE_03978 [Drechslerella stenobrocha 248]|uniref:DNA 3'-5' helicase n=1 Tax=Drechslerella stenobrocha 248 TaxID=1043628 RepID=W7I3G7_9PEZI|nr:hypothetical protein DRE_03978 [Drechslerella stenobrocha 248]
MTTKSRGPKNNLSSHLAWLLREKSTVPPQRTDKPPAQSISTAALAAIEAHSRSTGSAPSAKPDTAGKSNIVAVTRPEVRAPATNVVEQQDHIARNRPVGPTGDTSQSSTAAHQAPHKQKAGVAPAPITREQTAIMPVLQLAKTPSNRRRLTSLRQKEPLEDDGDSDPFEPVMKKSDSQGAASHGTKAGASFLDRYTQHCADGKGTRTPAATRKVVLPTGPVESIDLTLSDDEDIPNLPTSRFKQQWEPTRSSSATPSRTNVAERTTLPIGPSDPPPPYSSQELAVPGSSGGLVSRSAQPTILRSISRDANTMEEVEETAQTVTTIRKTKRRVISHDAGADEETPTIQVAHTALRTKSALRYPNGAAASAIAASAAGLPTKIPPAVREPRAMAYGTRDDEDGNNSDYGTTISRSVAGDRNPFNVDTRKHMMMPDVGQLPSFKRLSPARSFSAPQRDMSPKVPFDDDAVAETASPFYRSPQRTKRMLARKATPDPRELAQNLGKYLSPTPGAENVQLSLRGVTSAQSLDTGDADKRKKEIENEMLDMGSMMQAYTSGKYEGTLTLVQMAMKYEELQRKLFDFSRPGSSILATTVAVEQTQDTPIIHSPDHDAVDVYGTQNMVTSTPIRKTFSSRVAEAQSQFVKQTQYPYGPKNPDEIVSTTVQEADEFDAMSDNDDVFELAVSSPPDAKAVPPGSARPLDKGKGRAKADVIEDDAEEAEGLDSDGIPEDFLDFESDIAEQLQDDQDPSGGNPFTIEDLDEDDFELSPEDLEEINGKSSNTKQYSPSPDFEVLDQPPPNIFETRAKHISQLARDGGSGDLDDDIMEIGTQKATEVDMSAPSMGHPWSKEVVGALKSTFKLKGFRTHQLEAINVTLAGKDVFVLMPTGGGKSLCYQLPAVVTSGRTRGITFVISPLLALMEDQTEHLTQLGIRAYMFNSVTSPEAKREILNELKSNKAADSIQLLYVTPEMLVKSKTLETVMLSLHSRKLIARVVIDEAHCVSQWGHDFRKDYKEVGALRRKFPGVPFMALTATATVRTQQDTMHNLSITNCKVFKQSFNRPNLTYEVRSKSKEKDMMQQIVKIIQSPKYKGTCGIVYCLSRNNCEKVARELSQAGILAAFYHAGLESDDRRVIQRKWQKGQVKVIVATIAFGMGIDKPDVRFIIHHSIPKSLEGYYQETGRAGRDGKPSGCFMFYNAGDVIRLISMIEKGEGATPETIAHGKWMLNQVQQYCENKMDCRRVEVLKYFGEKFSKADCNKACDNCVSNKTYEARRVTNEARALLSIVSNAKANSLTVSMLIEIYRGSKAKAILQNQWDSLPGYGQGKDWNKDAVSRLVTHLQTEEVFGLWHIPNLAGFTNSYLTLGPKAHQVQQGSRNLDMMFENSPTAPLKKARKGMPSEEDFESTCISSPIGPSRALPRQPAMSQSTQLDADGFMPVRDGAARKRKSDGVGDDLGAPRRKKVAAQPIGIAADNIRAGLNDYDLDVLERFLKDAKRIRGDLINERGLRVESVFTDTELSWMGVKLPCSINEMMRMTQLADKDRIRLYGSKFLPVLQKYGNEKLENYEGTQYTPGGNSFIEEDDAEDESGEEDDDGDERSRYFGSAGHSQSAMDFSARLAAASQGATAGATKKAAGGRFQRRVSGGSSKGRGGKKVFAKRASGGKTRGGKRGGRSGSASQSGRGRAAGFGTSVVRPMI